jgi:pseudouridine synthase
VTKEYEVELNRPFDEADGIKLLNGIKLTEGVAKVDSVRKVGARRIVIKLHQGWNRQVRRMLGSLNYEAMILKRVAHGPIRLERLKVGTHRLLKASDFNL